jgi:phage tail-like protein
MSSSSGRAYAAAHFTFELDGADAVGLFRSIEGGGMRADVATYQVGGSPLRWRQLGKRKFEDVKVQVGMALSQPFARWVADFLAGRGARKNGAIVAADFSHAERARRELAGAMITELGFPKLDAADHAAAYLTVGLAVEAIAFSPGDATRKLPPPSGVDAQKRWTASSFRFRVDGLESACARVARVDAFTVKQAVVEYHAGGALAPFKMPGIVEFPNLAFYVPEPDAQPFADALASRRAPLNGALECFDAAGRTLFELGYRGAAIVGVVPERCDASSEDIKLVKVELCTEAMEFRYPRS